MMESIQSTIVAPATGEGGAIDVIRLSGPDAIGIGDQVFRHAKGSKLVDQKGYTLLYGAIVNESGTVVDDVLVSVFRAPLSYTGEDMLEISCHGSRYIKRELTRLLIVKGAEAAQAGEFTLRAFLNGKFDLSQAEAVADLIASENRATHALAMNQMKGGFSSELKTLRQKLLDLASLLELELDFSEEDVEFADRSQILQLSESIRERIVSLKNSFALGNAIKNGIPVAIAGRPNVGKSTLLNVLLNDDKALVSDIAGTTRDVIEDTVVIAGIEFRFIDTAGIRKTEDKLESMGIERTYQRIENAKVVLLVVDSEEAVEQILEQTHTIDPKPGRELIIVLNKTDHSQPGEVAKREEVLKEKTNYPVFALSAKNKTGVGELTRYLAEKFTVDATHNQSVVTNSRHYESLAYAQQSLDVAIAGLKSGLSCDLLAEDIRNVLYHLGTITGEITTEEILGSIFGKFCIGK